MRKFVEFFKNLMRSEDGVIEMVIVGLLLVFVALKMVNPAQTLGDTLKSSFDRINNAISNQLSNLTTQ